MSNAEKKQIPLSKKILSMHFIEKFVNQHANDQTPGQTLLQLEKLTKIQKVRHISKDLDAAVLRSHRSMNGFNPSLENQWKMSKKVYLRKNKK
eukprot:TRINITY_DN1723_c0_g1_i1.p1 TRINITY_DN1723_c0_g1~~TRINITY_DN1723_c0_g1_i1.p1  ORF type:complete len:106 (+),score=26.96 TRINITY_DN1723_c0_g1_i1:40-318(+)